MGGGPWIWDGQRCTAVAWALMALAGAPGCAADAVPLRGTAVVENASTSLPMGRGDTCTVALRPAWRQGVNCQVRIRCGDRDLFGGRRLGGYARCNAERGHFLDAVDRDEKDGDPALEVMLATRTIRWSARGEGQVTLRLGPLEEHPDHARGDPWPAEE